MRKFTGCVRSKRNLAAEWIHIRVLSNSNIEPLCVVKENSQRRSHSHVDQYDRTCPLIHVATPATADRDTSITSARVHDDRASPVMSTRSTARQYGMSLLSPITAHPVEIEWENATNTICSVSLLQKAGVKTLYISKRKCENMLHSYNYSYERRPKVNMARTKGSMQREQEQEKDRDSDHDRPAEGRRVSPVKRDENGILPVPRSMSATSATRLTGSVQITNVT